MIPVLDWIAPFERGLAHLLAREIDAGLTALDEVAELTGSRLAPFVSRSELLRRLRAFDDAFGEHSSVPSSRSTKEDAPRLFGRLASLPESVQIVLLVPSSADQKTKNIDDCVNFAKQQASTLHQSRNLIDHLPAEILTEIGRYAVLSADKPSSELALRLVAVSKRWENVFSRDVELWGHMRFDSNMRGVVKCIMEQAEVMLSRGPPRVVWIEGDDDGDLDGVYYLLRSIGTTLRELRASLAGEFGLDRIWGTLGPSAPLLRVLHIRSMEENLILSPLLLPHSSLPNLLNLTLVGVAVDQSTSLLPLLQKLPRLASLEIIGTYNLSLVVHKIEGADGGRIHLPSLVSLKVSDQTDNDLTYGNVRFHLVAPLLRELIIKDSYHIDFRDYLFPDDAPPNTSHLETLVFERSGADIPVNLALFRQDLCQMPVLTKLSMRHIVAFDVRGHRLSEKPDMCGLISAFDDLADGSDVPVPRLETLALCVRDYAGFDEQVLALVRSRRGGPPERAVRLRSLKFVDAGMKPETYDSLKADLHKFRNKAFRRSQRRSDRDDSDDDDEGNSLGYATDEDFEAEMEEQFNHDGTRREGYEDDSDW